MTRIQEMPLSHHFSLPSGWTYKQYRNFLQNGIVENKPALPIDEADEIADVDFYYPTLIDFDDKMLIFDDGDWDGDMFRIGYTITKGSAGRVLSYTEDIAVEVAEKMTYVDVAQMSQSARVDMSNPSLIAEYVLDDVSDQTADYVIRRGVVFEAGDYPDYPVTFTPDDLANVVANFKPVANRVSHANGPGRTPTYFDPHLGELTELTVSEDGQHLLGAVKLPKIFNDFYTQAYPDDPLKISLEFTNKIVTGSALVPNPRVESVALMSAFAAFSQGESPIVVRQIAGQTAPKETGMEGTEDKGTTTTPTAQVSTPVADYVTRAEFAATQADAEKWRKKYEDDHREKLEKEADAAARLAIQSGKFTAAMFADLKSQHLNAAQDDDATPRTITFALGDKEVQGTRVQALEAAWARMPASLHMAEVMPSEHHIINAFASGEPDKKAIASTQYDKTKEWAEKTNKNGTGGTR